MSNPIPPPSMPFDLRTVLPSTFHFVEPDKPCPYGSNGAHIINEMKCRCGMTVTLIEFSAKVES